VTSILSLLVSWLIILT